MVEGFDSEISTSTQKISRYNSADLINMRVHNLWTIFHRKVLGGKLIEANWVLDRLWGEFVGDTSEDDEKKFKDFVKEFNKVEEIKRDKEEFFKKMYSYIIEKESFIRKLQNKQGKGTAYEETIDEYMDV